MLRDLEGNIINLKEFPDALNNHRLIWGKSGSGKTWCCYRMIEEAVEQKKKCVILTTLEVIPQKNRKEASLLAGIRHMCLMETSRGLHTGIQARMSILLLKRH